ncbi:MAG: cold-shock protein [Phycisphaera sp.]|nr:cold-shock protein [Phycisphaera sp.]
MTKGQVKWFDPKKGYGFIVGPEGQDVFVHYSHIVADGFKSLKDGEWVEYELVQGEKGWQARSVKADNGGESVASTPSVKAQKPPVDVPVSGGYEGAPQHDD